MGILNWALVTIAASLSFFSADLLQSVQPPVWMPLTPITQPPVLITSTYSTVPPLCSLMAKEGKTEIDGEGDSGGDGGRGEGEW